LYSLSNLRISLLSLGPTTAKFESRSRAKRGSAPRRWYFLFEPTTEAEAAAAAVEGGAGVEVDAAPAPPVGEDGAAWFDKNEGSIFT